LPGDFAGFAGGVYLSLSRDRDLSVAVFFVTLLRTVHPQNDLSQRDKKLREKSEAMRLRAVKGRAWSL
jgi:hypothetical protein